MTRPAHISTVPIAGGPEHRDDTGRWLPGPGTTVRETHGMCRCSGDPTPCRWFTPQCKRCYRPILDQSATVEP